MGVKQSLREFAPPTTRNFEASLAGINDKLVDLESQLSKLECNDVAVIDEFNKINQQINSLRNELGDVNFKVQKMNERQDYSNLEYLQVSLNQGVKPKVLLAGYFGDENLGDELMLRTMFSYLDTANLDYYVLLWDNPDYTCDGFPVGIKKVHYPSSTWQLQTLASVFDAVVWCGGAIIDDNQFDDNPKNLNTGNLFIRLNKEMLGLGKIIYSIGLSVSTNITNHSFVENLKLVIENSELFSVRDSFSHEELIRLGISEDKLQLTNDIVFAEKQVDFNELALRSSRKGLCRIGVALLTFRDELEDFHKELLKRLAEIKANSEQDIELALIPFWGFRSIDEARFKKFTEEFDLAESFEIAPYVTDIKQNQVFDCDFLISERYHGCALGLAAGIQTLVLSVSSHPHYKFKMEGLSKLFGCESNLYDVSNEETQTKLLINLEQLLEGAQKPVIPENLFSRQQNEIESFVSKLEKDLC